MNTATVADSLTVHGDLRPHEIEELIDHWSPLDARLRSFDAGTVRLDLHVKDRDARGQHLTLEAHIDRFPPLIATAADEDLTRGLNTVRDEMIRQIGRSRDRRNPRHRHG